MCNEELMAAAEAAMQNAYAPYSGFRVGAALIAENKDGKTGLFCGCNIENASFSPTMCAERVAVADAVKSGFTHIIKIAVCGEKDGEKEQICPPCGVCRQVLTEFGDQSTEIILRSAEGLKVFTLRELLPLSFSLEHY